MSASPANNPASSPGAVGVEKAVAPDLAAWLSRHAGRFLVRLAVCYGVWLLLWLPLGAPFERAFVATGNAVFAFSGRVYAVTFLRLPDPAVVGLPEHIDVAVLVRKKVDPRPQQWYAKGIVTLMQPYAATGFLLALILATEIGRGARLLRAALTVPLLFGFMYTAVAIDVAYALAANGAGLDRAPRWLVESVALLHATVTDWPAGVLIVPLILWLLACWPWQTAPARANRLPTGSAR